MITQLREDLAQTQEDESRVEEHDQLQLRPLRSKYENKRKKERKNG